MLHSAVTLRSNFLHFVTSSQTALLSQWCYIMVLHYNVLYRISDLEIVFQLQNFLKLFYIAFFLLRIVFKITYKIFSNCFISHFLLKIFFKCNILSYKFFISDF